MGITECFSENPLAGDYRRLRVLLASPELQPAQQLPCPDRLIRAQFYDVELRCCEAFTWTAGSPFATSLALSAQLAGWRHGSGAYQSAAETISVSFKVWEIGTVSGEKQRLGQRGYVDACP